MDFSTETKKIVYRLSILIFFILSNPLLSYGDTYLLYRITKPDPEKKFYTISTKHFLIHFHDGLENWAKNVASVAEEVHKRLTIEFAYQPEEKTQIVIMDNNDLVNGYALVFPYNTIFLNVGFPDLETTIGEYDDFIFNLVLHEYAHILSMDVSSGYSKALRKIFGKPIPAETPTSALFFLILSPPNIFMPRWWHEGIATELESRHGYGGRGNRSFYQMVFRMASLEGVFPTIDEINGDIPFFPSGNTPYLYGYNLFAYLKEKYSLNYGTLTKKQAEHFPYFINGVPLQLFDGKDYDVLFEESLVWLKNNQQKSIKKITEKPIVEGESFSLPFEIVRNSRFSKDGTKIASRVYDPDIGDAVIIMEKDTKKIIEKISTKHSRGSIAFSSDGKKIYFTKMDRRGIKGFFQSLYEFDIEKRKTKKVIDDLRVKDFDLSPTGEEVVLIFVENGKEGIVKTSLDNLKEREIILPPKEVRIGQVRWANKSQFVLFSERDGEKSGINIINLNTKETKVLLTSKAILEYPVFSPDDRYIYYISDRTGVYNIYERELDGGNERAITNLLGGAFFIDVSPDGELIFSSYHAKGMELRKVALKGDNHHIITAPVIKEEENIIDVKEYNENKETNLAEYSAFPSVTPKFFIPNILSDHKGTVLGLFTAGQDAIGYHTYTLEVDRGLASGENYYNFSYINDVFTPTFKLTAYSQPFLYNNFEKVVDFWEKSNLVRLESLFPVKGAFLKIGYEHETKEPLGYYGSDFQKLLFKGEMSTLLFGLDFINVKKYPNSISFEEGRKISVLSKVSTTLLGGDLSKTDWLLFYDEYIDVQATNLKHDVFHLNFNAGLSTGREIAQGAFQIGGYPTPYITFPLRGYAPRFETGKYIYTGSLEYRFKVTDFNKGRGTTPIFYEKLSINTFFDFGHIWGYKKPFSNNDVKTAVGYELKLDITAGYWLKVTPTLGVAKGLAGDGEKQLYFTIYSNF